MLKNNSEIHETPCTDEIRKPCFLCILQLCTDLFFSGVSREQRSIAPFNILIAVEREQNIVLFASLPVSEIESTLILFCAMSAFKNLSGTKKMLLCKLDQFGKYAILYLKLQTPGLFRRY